MNILIVYCHPRPITDSFSGAVLERFRLGAEEAGHHCEVADLYREGFDPIMSARDMQQFEGVTMPSDVLREQRRIEESDGLCMIFPIWWYGMPAMMKGWFDRVWSAGWAYKWEKNVSGSLLARRPCTLLLPIGSNEGRLERWSYDKHLDNIWRNGVLDFCGVAPIDIQFLVNSDGFESSPFADHLDRSFQTGLNFGTPKTHEPKLQ